MHKKGATFIARRTHSSYTDPNHNSMGQNFSGYWPYVQATITKSCSCLMQLTGLSGCCCAPKTCPGSLIQPRQSSQGNPAYTDPDHYYSWSLGATCSGWGKFHWFRLCIQLALAGQDQGSGRIAFDAITRAQVSLLTARSNTTTSNRSNAGNSQSFVPAYACTFIHAYVTR